MLGLIPGSLGLRLGLIDGHLGLRLIATVPSANKIINKSILSFQKYKISISVLQPQGQ